MNKLFEKFVAYQLKDKYNLPVETQEQKYYLIRQDKFILKPDIVIRRNNKIYILDTKWKKISQDVKDISQADLYQMLSYATVYRVKENQDIELYLIYPKTDKFKNPMKFNFNDFYNTILILFPFDIKRHLLKKL